MGMPSLTTIGSFVFLAYMSNSLWSIGKLYFPPSCDTSVNSKMVRKMLTLKRTLPNSALDKVVFQVELLKSHLLLDLGVFA